MVQSGKWMALSEEQSKIIALETKLNKMGNSGSKSTSSGGKSTNAPKKSNSGNSKSSSSNKKKGKKDTPAWMTQWPGRAAVDSNQPKVKDGKTYYWCKNHKKYCMHKTSEWHERGSNPLRGQTSDPRYRDQFLEDNIPNHQ